MRKDGENCAVVVSDLVQNGKRTKSHPYGMIIWSNH